MLLYTASLKEIHPTTLSSRLTADENKVTAVTGVLVATKAEQQLQNKEVEKVWIPITSK